MDSNEILLAEAKQKYPIGTIFRVVHQPNTICEVKSHDYYDNTFINCGGNLHINFIVSEPNDDAIGGSVYVSGCGEEGWAEIISKPEIETEIEKDLLLKEAKKRYPIGTEYWTAHVRDRICLVHHDNFHFNENNPNDMTIYLGDGNFKINGHSCSEIVYHMGEWAKIVSPHENEVPQTKSFKIFN